MKLLTIPQYDAYFFGYCDGRNVQQKNSSIEDEYLYEYNEGFKEGNADLARYEGSESMAQIAVLRDKILECKKEEEAKDARYAEMRSVMVKEMNKFDKRAGFVRDSLIALADEILWL